MSETMGREILNLTSELCLRCSSNTSEVLAQINWGKLALKR